MKKYMILFLVLISHSANAQYPGAFYAFELIGSDGEIVDSSDKNYKLSIDTIAPGPSSIRICDDNKTWRLYKGDKNLYVSNFLIIEKLSDGKVVQSMSVKFPPPLTGGKEKYYGNMYIGKIKFGKSHYKVRFPKTSGEWDSLKEIEFCPDEYNYNKYLDISKYQKK